MVVAVIIQACDEQSLLIDSGTASYNSPLVTYSLSGEISLPTPCHT